jgi:hypothetical protein
VPLRGAAAEEAPPRTRCSDVSFVRVLRDLWRLRVFVALVAMVAIVAAILTTCRVALPGKIESRQYQVGVATTRVLVDTPSSQVVAVSPKGSDTLGVRATLMASLMVDGVIKDLIARRAGLSSEELVGIAKDAEDGVEPVETPPGHDANVLRTSVLQDTEGKQLPIIQIETQAVDAPHAAKLADAAVEGLRDYLATQAAKQQVPDAHRLRVNGLGAAQAGEVTRGPGVVLGLVAGLFVFAFGCALLLGVIALVRNLRMPEEPAAAPLKLVDDEPVAEVVANPPVEKATAPTNTVWRWDKGAESSPPTTDGPVNAPRTAHSARGGGQGGSYARRI